MRHIFAAVVVLPLLAAPASAQCMRGGTINFGFCGSLTAFGGFSPLCCPPNCGPGGGPGGGGGPAQAGPWYLYWPMEAHFTDPAPTGYPYWPSPQTLPNGAGAVQKQNGVAPSHYFQPTAYAPGVPSYWYGR